MSELHLDWMGGLLGVFLILFLWSLYRLGKSHTEINMFDLVVENERLSKIAVAFMLTLLVTTWIMVYLTLANKITEGYIGLYGSMWVGPLVARVIFGHTNGEAK